MMRRSVEMVPADAELRGVIIRSKGMALVNRQGKPGFEVEDAVHFHGPIPFACFC